VYGIPAFLQEQGAAGSTTTENITTAPNSFYLFMIGNSYGLERRNSYIPVWVGISSIAVAVLFGLRSTGNLFATVVLPMAAAPEGVSPMVAAEIVQHWSQA